MKTIQKKWLLPAMVFALAIASAFATTVEKPNSAVVKGYIDAPTPCKISVNCSLIPGPACKQGTQTAYRMNSAGTLCDQPVFKL
ncbi:DUF6520 family protein [Croceibacter atlanticus]|uniref:DUF6520 family protein n=1 Tax=Croceibacter atlanticus TaxID=313588 RepID=UPI003CD0D700